MTYPSSQSKELGEVVAAVVAVDGDAAQVGVGEHVLAVPRTVDPPIHCYFHWITHVVVVGHVFREGTHEKWYLLHSILEAFMAYGVLALSHVDVMGHANVMQGLVPREGWQSM